MSIPRVRSWWQRVGMMKWVLAIRWERRLWNSLCGTRNRHTSSEEIGPILWLNVSECIRCVRWVDAWCLISMHQSKCRFNYGLSFLLLYYANAAAHQQNHLFCAKVSGEWLKCSRSHTSAHKITFDSPISCPSRTDFEQLPTAGTRKKAVRTFSIISRLYETRLLHMH